MLSTRGWMLLLQKYSLDCSLPPYRTFFYIVCSKRLVPTQLCADLILLAALHPRMRKNLMFLKTALSCYYPVKEPKLVWLRGSDLNRHKPSLWDWWATFASTPWYVCASCVDRSLLICRITLTLVQAHGANCFRVSDIMDKFFIQSKFIKTLSQLPIKPRQLALTPETYLTSVSGWRGAPYSARSTGAPSALIIEARTNLVKLEGIEPSPTGWKPVVVTT